MKFCKSCENMYYVGTKEDTDDLIYYCRFCGDIDNNTENVVVLQSQIKKSEHNFTHIVNPYTKYDPTLPRIRGGAIKCPNEQCTDPQKEIIYMRYDDDNLKYLYICTTCDTTWKNS